MTRLIRRIPISLALILIITALALATGALTSPTPHSVIARWGFSLDNLARGRLGSIFAAEVLVEGRAHWLSTMAMMLAFVAPLEALAGSRLLLLVYWPSSILGTLIASITVGLPSRLVAWDPRPDLVTFEDVGASVGQWGAAGALAVIIGVRYRRLGRGLFAAGALFLLYFLLLKHGIADFAHPFGYLIGATIGRSGRRRG